MSVTEQPVSTQSSPGWGEDLQAAICERCNWRYLLPAVLTLSSTGMPLCPHCFRARLTAVPENLSEAPYPYPPELVAPFAITDPSLEETVRQFARGIPYAPKDLNFAAMRSRLTPIYLPSWLVDGKVDAFWKAEAGFNYEVVSHQEHYSDSGYRGEWQTKELREGRIRWEARVGKLEREYQNVEAPALEETAALRQAIGDFNLTKAEAYQPAHLMKAWVRLPDRSTQDAWSEASATFQKRAAGECQSACDSDHLRMFKWKAEFNRLNWTLMLLPVYTTFYLDDENKPQAVLIHGQSGHVTGQRRASMQRAKRTSLIFFIIGLVVALLGLAMGLFSAAMPPLAPLSILAFVVGLPLILAALVPIGIAWDFNRKQAQNE